MSISLANYEKTAREAVMHFWQSRSGAQERQKAKGVQDAGTRGAVIGGKTMDVFIDLVRSVVAANGLPVTALYNCREDTTINRHDTLPGFYRPTKDWDLLVVSNEHLIAAIELKSHVGSYGNNFNNRCEEAIGTSTDFWTAYREGTYDTSPRPFVGYLMLLGDSEEVHQAKSSRSSHFDVRPEFNQASYAQRYEIFCRKLVQEGLFTEAAILLSEEEEGRRNGSYRELSEATGLRRFVVGLAGHVASAAALLK